MKDGTWASVVAISTGTPRPSTIFSKRAIELGLWMSMVVSLVKQLYVITNAAIASLKYCLFVNEFTQWTITITITKVEGSNSDLCFSLQSVIQTVFVLLIFTCWFRWYVWSICLRWAIAARRCEQPSCDQKQYWLSLKLPTSGLPNSRQFQGIIYKFVGVNKIVIQKWTWLKKWCGSFFSHLTKFQVEVSLPCTGMSVRSPKITSNCRLSSLRRWLWASPK